MPVPRYPKFDSPDNTDSLCQLKKNRAKSPCFRFLSENSHRKHLRRLTLQPLEGREQYLIVSFSQGRDGK